MEGGRERTKKKREGGRRLKRPKAVAAEGRCRARKAAAEGRGSRPRSVQNDTRSCVEHSSGGVP